MKTKQNGHKAPQNSGKREMPRGKRFESGKSGNPGGRPKNQKSITYWLGLFGNMSGEEVAVACEVYAKEFKKAKGDVPLFAIIAARALLTLMNESEARLLGHVLDRTEGKVTQPLDVNWRDSARKQGYDPDRLFTALVDAGRTALARSGNSGSDSSSE